ncbi:hypothetical protein LCGC14_1944470, partial [marine sediment metagenome]
MMKFRKFTLILLFLLIATITMAHQYAPDIIVTSPSGLWTDTRAYTSLADALTAIGGNERNLYIVRQEDYTGAIPATASLNFMRVGSINATGAVTINSKSIIAGNRRIFFGAGALTFADGSVLKSAWFDDIDEAIAETNTDTVTILMTQAETAATTAALGNDVTLKWDAPGNALSINTGRIISNISSILAGDYEIITGAGRADFVDGTTVWSTWFDQLRTVGRHIDNSSLELEIRKSEALDYDYTFPATTSVRSKAGNIITINGGRTLTINGHYTAGNYLIKDGAGTLVLGTNVGVVNVNWVGTIGEAISISNGKRLLWPSGTYSLSAVVSETLTADQEWVAEGPVLVQWNGAANAIMIGIEQASFDINIKGPFIFDANSLARYPIRLDNTSATMADAARAILTDVWGINAYTTINSNNAGLAIVGGYDYVRIERGGASNISRAGGLTAATAGIIIAHTSVNAYIRKAILVDVEVDTVTSLDAPPVADMDCVSISGPSADDNGGVKIDSSAVIRGGRFINCQGRTGKFQTELNLVTGTTVIRNSAGKITIANGVEYDFQYGSGVAINNEFWYEALAGNTTPFGASFKVINATVRGFTEEGSLVVKNNTIINEVPNSATVDDIPIFVLIADAGGGTFRSIVVDDNTHLGGGR